MLAIQRPQRAVEAAIDALPLFVGELPSLDVAVVGGAEAVGGDLHTIGSKLSPSLLHHLTVETPNTLQDIHAGGGIQAAGVSAFPAHPAQSASGHLLDC